MNIRLKNKFEQHEFKQFGVTYGENGNEKCRIALMFKV